MEGLVNFALVFSYILVIVAGLGVVVLPLINAMSNPKSLYKGLAGVAIIGVVFLISWGIAGSEVTASYTRYGVDASSSKMVGGALTMMYILIFIALIGIIYTEISKAIN